MREIARVDTASGSIRFVDVGDVTRSTPVVLRAGRAIALRLQDGAPTLGWVDARATSDGALVAIVDNRIESPGPELLVLASDDGGAQWELRGVLRKPHYLATLTSLRVTDRRRFEVVVKLEDCADCGVELGTTVYETSDGGCTWAAAGQRARH